MWGTKLKTKNIKWSNKRNSYLYNIEWLGLDFIKARFEYVIFQKDLSSNYSKVFSLWLLVKCVSPVPAVGT